MNIKRFLFSMLLICLLVPVLLRALIAFFPSLPSIPRYDEQGLFASEVTFWMMAVLYSSITFALHSLPNKSKIKSLPGNTISKIFRFLLNKKTYELFVESKIADEINEYIEALDNKEFYRARYIKIRVWIVALYSIALILPSRFVKVMQSIVKK
jgi:hypothetical protein